MKTVKHNQPFPLLPNWLHDFFENEDAFGSSLNRDIVPAVNVIENDGDFEIQIAAPGFDRDDFDVAIDGDTLIVNARRESENKDEQEGRFMRREFSYSSFTRAFALPEDSRAEGMTATYKDGILRLRLERVPEAKRPEPKHIEIH